MKKLRSHSITVAPIDPQSSSLQRGSYSNPLDYDHPWPSMAEFAKLLNLRNERVRTVHAYYRDLRLIQSHFNADPARLSED